MQDGLDPTPGINNQFATIPDVSVDAIANRVAPRQMQTGNLRGSAQVIPGSDGNPQVLIGNQQTFGNGLFVAKSGIDATSNTDPANWRFNSNQNNFKIVLTDTYTFPSTSVGAGLNVYQAKFVPHGLTTVPKVQLDGLRDISRFGADELALFTTSIYVPLSYRQSLDITSNLTNTILFGANATNVYLGLTNFNGTAGTLVSNAYTVRYYVIQETAAI